MANIAIARRDPAWAPCCFILCRTSSRRDFHYRRDIRCDEKQTQLVQLDWDYPGVASSFGWNKENLQGNYHCRHDGTDGTIDCPCGVNAQEFIDSAREYLFQCAVSGKVVEDPGYFA